MPARQNLFDRGHVDLLAFEDQAADLLGDAGLDPDNKAQGLADMLSTWETPLDGLRGTSRLAELTAPFEELRFQAVEGLTAAQIAGTRAGDAVKMLPANRAVLADACARGGDLGDDRQRARAMAERAVTVATAGGYGDIQSDAQTVLARLP